MIVALLCFGSFGSFAAYNGEAWEEAALYVMLEPNGVSNCGLCFATIRVKYDYTANRMYVLYFLEYNKFEDDMLSGVIMNVNGMGPARIMADGSTEYDSDIYYAQLDAEYVDKRTKSVIMETTLGIKDGIPKNVEMDIIVIDACGVRSNTFHLDVTERVDSTVTARSSTSRVKTTKQKTTKQKTTKVKTTKEKTENSETTEAEVTENDSDLSPTVFSTGIDDGVKVNNKRKRLATAFCGAATIIAAASGCSIGIKNRRKKGK